MARGFNALRAALGAVTGVAEGLQQRELLAEKRKREQDAMARQQAMDLASLMAQGWQRPEDITQKTGEARGAIGSLVGSALQAASTGMPAGGPSARGMQALESGYATQQAPSRTINVGGMDLALRESPSERQERLASTQAVQGRVAAQEAQRMKGLESQRKESILAKALSRGATEADKVAAMNEGLLTFGQAGYATAAEKAQAERAKRLDALQERKFKAEIAKLNADDKIPATEIDKRLPVGARNDIADYNAAIYTLQKAQEEVANNPEAFGLMSYGMSKLGSVGRTIREKQEGEKSQAYTKARAQLQSALMKLRKTQFGTQMTRLEKDTGEEVFPSGAESPERLSQMIDVLLGNAENLRRGVYDANNAVDMYRPIVAPPAAQPSRKWPGG
jgi:hypothetical protein